MKKLFTIAFCCLGLMKCLALGPYYISPTGNDGLGHSGSSGDPFLTLEGAYNNILDDMATSAPCNVTATVNIYLDGNINLMSNSYPYVLNWQISGTSSYHITITSDPNDNTTYSISRPAGDSDKGAYMITFRDVDYITVSNIKFNDATRAINLEKANYCTISYCEFICTNIAEQSGGAGTISLSNNDEENAPNCNYNTIIYNKIDGQGEGMTPGTVYDNVTCSYYVPKSIGNHGIYLGRASDNQISYNQVNNMPGAGIHCWHGYTQDNQISENVINVCYNDYEWVNGTYPYKGKEAIILSYDGQNTSPASVSGNIIERNYCAGNVATLYYTQPCVSYTPGYAALNGTRDLLVDSAINSISSPSHNGNQYSSNYFYYDASRFAVDPFWVYYNPSLVASRIVTGDFDGDTYKDDIAALYATGSSTAALHVWISNDNKLFEYCGSPWWSSTYDASKVTARLVCGDFDGNGKDDIAALYDLTASDCRLDVWTSSGSAFTLNSPWWTASSHSYDATKVTGRIAAGDFNNDGYDDIAAMYDYGSSNSAIHVWTSGGSSFSPSGSAYTWWTSGLGAYNANNATTRFVSGDFDGNGKDDIAAMYNYGSSNSTIHAWVSSGSSFTSQNWWTASSNSYDATKTSGRFVCGDFDNNGYDDIATMYDYGSSNAHLHSFLSDGSSFQPSTYANDWWTSNANSYPVSKVTNRMVCGDFNNDGKSDIAAMYDYSFNTNFYRTRFHVWECSGSSFDMQNNSLGYPWTNYATNLEIACADGEEELGKKAWDNGQPNGPANQEIIEEPKSYSFTAYPNPAAMELTIEYALPKSSKVGVQLFNVYGQKVMSLLDENALAGRYNRKMDISSLQSGVYTLKYIVDGNPVHTQKLVKQ